MEYSSAVERHFAAPKNARELPGGSPGLVAGEAEDRTLHVWVRFQLKIVDGVVAAAGFQAYGCPHTVAAASATRIVVKLRGRIMSAPVLQFYALWGKRGFSCETRATL